MSDSSYSSTAPNPLHRGQAPRGLLNEKSCGDGAGRHRAVVGTLETLGEPCGTRRERASAAPAWDRASPPAAPRSSTRTTHVPSPSRNAVATASARRPATFESAVSLSVTTSNSAAPVSDTPSASSASSSTGRPSATTRRNPWARRFSATTASVTREDRMSGKVTRNRVPGASRRISSLTDCTVSGRSSRPQRGQNVRPMRAHSRRRKS